MVVIGELFVWWFVLGYLFYVGGPRAVVCWFGVWLLGFRVVYSFV